MTGLFNPIISRLLCLYTIRTEEVVVVMCKCMHTRICTNTKKMRHTKKKERYILDQNQGITCTYLFLYLLYFNFEKFSIEKMVMLNRNTHTQYSTHSY